MYTKDLRMDRSRKILLVLFDILCFAVVAASYYGATFIFQHSVKYEITNYLINSAILLVSMFFWRFVSRIYLSVWRYTNTAVYLKMILADAAGGVTAILVSRIWGLLGGVWHDVWHFVILSSLCCLVG